MTDENETSAGKAPADIKGHGLLLGENNNEVFQGLLGMSEKELDRLKAEEVVY